MIDVMLPFYGDQALFHQAVRSVLAQDDADWRLIVVDDADPGPSVHAWLESLGDDRVTYLRNERNLGVAANFRRCLDLATAEHVMFMGCDDVMHPHFVSTVRTSIAEHPDAAVVQPRVQVIDTDGLPVRTVVDVVKDRLSPYHDGAGPVLSGEPLAASLLRGNWMYFPAIVWRRELIAQRQFRPDLSTVLDLELLLHLVGESHEFVLPDTLAFSYRRHRQSASSVTARSAERFEEEARVFAEYEAGFGDLGWTRAVREARRHLTSRLHAACLVPTALSSGNTGAAQVLARHAFARG